ncbi:MFS transporter, FHS family, L-fucose permease [Duganella sp. CF517]|uniref:sugar MFS transporter n=1 Tax=Duganella sp. CF517 TaxID=1881038 RepID=UPI0008AD52B0|nr:sugar MFS transporter [Duganella sp. CF517]SEN30836.1 MFS transporter, FHS family, L-fucose permease [Duganella sp. CF517]
MEPLSKAAGVPGSPSQAKGNTGPLIIITILFFMWGLLTALNDVLIPHLKSIYTLTYVQAMLVQFCFFGAYFIVSLPAGALIKRIGYQNGAVAGLTIAAAGCALFYPASTSGYALFLLAFFILAGGITILQVAANPYVTILGDPQTASSRLTLTQAFNSLGTTVAPTLGGMLILAGGVMSTADLAKLPADQVAAYYANQAASVQGPYLALAGALLVLAILFAMARLPKIVDAEQPAARAADGGGWKLVLQHRHLVLGVVGIFLYVGAEVCVGSFLINFIGLPHIAGLPEHQAAPYVSYFWGGAMLGRFIGFAVMRYVSPGKALAFNSAAAFALLLVAIFGSGHTAMWALLGVGLFNSIMFPTIFSMALNKLGPLTGQGSGLLCMAIVGGALVPFAQGFLADTVNLQISFVVPAACYVFVLYFGLKYAGMYADGGADKPAARAGH